MQFSSSNRFPLNIQNKIRNWLRFWGARMPQIAECFPRSVECTDLSETVQCRWRQVGNYRLEMGFSIIHAGVEAVQSQVISEHINVYPYLILVSTGERKACI